MWEATLHAMQDIGHVGTTFKRFSAHDEDPSKLGAKSSIKDSFRELHLFTLQRMDESEFNNYVCSKHLKDGINQLYLLRDVGLRKTFAIDTNPEANKLPSASQYGGLNCTCM